MSSSLEKRGIHGRIHKVLKSNWLLLEGQSVWDFFFFFQPLGPEKKNMHHSQQWSLGGEWLRECGGEEPDSGMNITVHTLTHTPQT